MKKLRTFFVLLIIVFTWSFLFAETPMENTALKGTWVGAIKGKGKDVKVSLELEENKGEVKGFFNILSKTGGDIVKGESFTITKPMRIGKRFNFIVPVTGNIDKNAVFFYLKIEKNALVGIGKKNRSEAEGIPIKFVRQSSTATDKAFMKRLEEFKIKYPGQKEGLLPPFYAQSDHNAKTFMKRFEEFRTKYPEQKKGSLPVYYAQSNHNAKTFMKRLEDFKTKYPEQKEGFLAIYYAQSEYSAETFMKRLEKFKTKYPEQEDVFLFFVIISPSASYAQSNNSTESFIKRFEEFNTKYPEQKEGFLSVYYAASSHRL